MPTKTLIFKRKIYYNILKFFGLCSACFVFEACYGAPRNEAEPIENFKYSGNVISQDSLKPIPNVKVEINNGGLEKHIVYTDSKGYYEKIVEQLPSNTLHKIEAIDVDSSINGNFTNEDSSFYLNSTNLSEKNILCNLQMKRKK